MEKDCVVDNKGCIYPLNIGFIQMFIDIHNLPRGWRLANYEIENNKMFERMNKFNRGLK